MNKLLDIKNIQISENIVAVNFNTSEEVKTKITFDDNTIKSCGEILADYLIKYIKNGGDINNLAPQNVLKK